MAWLWSGQAGETLSSLRPEVLNISLDRLRSAGAQQLGGLQAGVMEHRAGPNRLTPSPIRRGKDPQDKQPCAFGYWSHCHSIAACQFSSGVGGCELVSKIAQPWTRSIVPSSRHLNRQRVALVIPTDRCCRTGLCWGKSHSLVSGPAQKTAEITSATCEELGGLLLISQAKGEKETRPLMQEQWGFTLHVDTDHTVTAHTDIWFSPGPTYETYNYCHTLMNNTWRLLRLSLIC